MLMSSWTVGYAVVPFLGVFMLAPQGAGYNWHLFGQSGWRLIYIALCCCSSVATLGLALTVPESLRFLLLRGRRTEARRLLGAMVRGGAISVPRSLAEERLCLDLRHGGGDAAATVDARSINDGSGGGGGGSNLSVALVRQVSTDQFKEQLPVRQVLWRLVCSPGMWRTTACLWLIWFPISFAGNGFAVFLPMMQRQRHVPTGTVMTDNMLWAGAGTVGILFGSTLLESKTLGRRCVTLLLDARIAQCRPSASIKLGAIRSLLRSLTHSCVGGCSRTLAIGLLGCALSYLAFALARGNAAMVAVSIGCGCVFSRCAYAAHGAGLIALSEAVSCP